MPSVILVTGSSTGIGRLVVETVARAGHVVYATMRDVNTRNASASAALQCLAEKDNLALRTLEMDVRDTDSVQRAVDQVHDAAGRIDVVVNNAGLMSIGLADWLYRRTGSASNGCELHGTFPRLSRGTSPDARAT
jgi:NAD(P)-dependent dehydrogenase (short-subunit alcohol dehydrogenase family)